MLSIQEMVQHRDHEGGDPLNLPEEPLEEPGLPLGNPIPVNVVPTQLLEDAIDHLLHHLHHTVLLLLLQETVPHTEERLDEGQQLSAVHCIHGQGLLPQHGQEPVLVLLLDGGLQEAVLNLNT